MLGTPTAAPPIWLTKNHPEILPMDERGLAAVVGTRHACCLNSDLYWDYSKKIIRAMAEALGKHPQLIGWQIDNNVGAHSMQPCFNEETQRDWHAWLKAKYGTLGRLNDMMGTRFWGQVVTDWAHVPMPKTAPAPHNPALDAGLAPLLQRYHRGLCAHAGGFAAGIDAPCAGHDQHARLRPACGFV